MNLKHFLEQQKLNEYRPSFVTPRLVARIAVAWVVTMGVLISLIYAQGTHPAAAPNRVSAEEAVSAFEVLRQVGALIGLGFMVLSGIFTITGAFAYWKVAAKTRAMESMRNTIINYQDELDVVKLRNATLMESAESLKTRIEERDKLLTDLQNRTDLTKVMDLIASFMAVSSTRYTEAMTTIQKMLQSHCEQTAHSVSIIEKLILQSQQRGPTPDAKGAPNEAT